MSKKIAFLGAGSLGFTRGLLRDILAVKALQNIEVTFVDINTENLKMVTEICQRDIDANGLNIKIQSTTNRREGFKNADYVVNAIRVGMLEAYATDIDIPLKYGVDQCVGDTICIGGIMYGQRGIPVLLDVCKDIREVSNLGCMLLNYSNPNAMLTWACNKYGKVPTLGLCHGIQHGHEQIAQAFGVTLQEVEIICAGINHQTWYTNIMVNGVDRTDELYKKFLQQENMVKNESIRLDVMKNFGYYSTESNGHLSEYLAWYRKRPEDMKKWINFSDWIQGETRGYLRVCQEGRDWFEVDFPNLLEEPPFVYAEEHRSLEHAGWIIESLETGRVYRGHFNIMNNGCITNLPDECAIEVPVYVDFNGLSVPQVGDLPLGCAAICSQSIWVQKLAVEAAVTGDINLLYQAAMMDPLTGAVCLPVEIRQMVDEMLVAGAEWLPQYATEIPKARERMAGELVPYRPVKGFTQVTKTVEVMSQNVEAARANAGAAAKEMVGQ